MSNMVQDNSWRDRLHEIIFEADTPTGKFFDVFLIWAILLSVLTVILDSVAHLRAVYGDYFYVIEWSVTVLFSIEYILRLICVKKPLRYATSFFGVIDLLAVLPTYISLLVAGSQYLVVIRILRVLRVFRVLKMVQYLGEASLLMEALRASRRKISIFLFTVLTLVVVLGSLMYLIEGAASGFTNIPRGIYWAIVTLTTVGYGDIVPVTLFGQFLATLVMIMGYAIIAVPTGIVSVELGQAYSKKISTQACLSCSKEGHDPDAKHCKYCGALL